MSLANGAEAAPLPTTVSLAIDEKDGVSRVNDPLRRADAEEQKQQRRQPSAAANVRDSHEKSPLFPRGLPLASSPPRCCSARTAGPQALRHFADPGETRPPSGASAEERSHRAGPLVHHRAVSDPGRTGEGGGGEGPDCTPDRKYN